MSDDTPSPLNNVITIDDERIKSHLDRVVRGTVEETLNALLDAEADRLCNAQRYERSAARRDTRAGHYERGLQTKAGEVRLRVPKLRQQTFETAIIERYRRRESSVEEALIEMYLAGVSVRRVEDITEALWGTRVSPSTVSDLNKKIYGTIDAAASAPAIPPQLAKLMIDIASATAIRLILKRSKARSAATSTMRCWSKYMSRLAKAKNATVPRDSLFQSRPVRPNRCTHGQTFEGAHSGRSPVQADAEGTAGHRK